MYFVDKSPIQVTIGLTSKPTLYQQQFDFRTLYIEIRCITIPGNEPLQGEVGPWSSANKQWNQDVSYNTGNCRQNSEDFQPYIHQD